jgi:hypothetical protein
MRLRAGRRLAYGRDFREAVLFAGAVQAVEEVEA